MTGISIYFFKGASGVFDWLIRKWTRSPYSHCAIVFNYENGTKLLFEAQNGVGVRSLITIPGVTLRDSQWDHIDIPVSPESRQMVQNWCSTELGCKYDWMGLFWSQVLFIPRSHPDKWFCSEYVAAALEKLSMLGGKRPCTFSPGSLWRDLKGIK